MSGTVVSGRVVQVWCGRWLLQNYLKSCPADRINEGRSLGALFSSALVMSVCSVVVTVLWAGDHLSSICNGTGKNGRKAG